MCDLYCQHYRRQLGGSFPVFAGIRYQQGNGLGDFFRSVGRFFLPIATNVAKQFITTTASGLSEGQMLKDAAKSAIAPTIAQGLSSIVEQAAARHQKGQGRRRRRHSSRVYKAAKRTRVATKPKHKKSKKARILPTRDNF